MFKGVMQFIPKIHRTQLRAKHILVLFLLLTPIVLIGISNYFFASSSFHFVADPEDAKILTRQWIGDYDGIYMSIILGIVTTALWLTGFFTGKLDSFLASFMELVKNLINYIKNNHKKVILHTGILLSIVIAALVIASATTPGTSAYGRVRLARTVFYTAIGLSGYFIIMIRRNVQKIFFLLSITIGLVYIISHPQFFFSWDTSIHYAWSLEASFVRYASITEADIALANNAWIPFSATPAYDGYPQFLSGDELATVRQYRLGTYTLAPHNENVLPLYNRLAYIPAGIMLFIGRSLALAPLTVLKFGMLGSHLVYTILAYFAIKRLNSGKHIMAVIAMFPTAFLLSTAYSYDYWVIAFALLGFAYYFYEVQSPDKKIELKNIVIMIGSFVIGMAPKAGYVTLMFVLYFIKQSKFKTKKGHYFYLLAVTCGMFIIMSSFIIPYLTGYTGQGDIRGSDDVSYSNQISFILNNPLTYMGIVLSFLREYLNVFTGTNYVTGFAGLGGSSFFYLTWLLLLFVMFTDRNEKNLITIKTGYKVLISIVALGTIVFFITAMYISFTPPGVSYIQGVQPRYMLPVLFPVLYIIGGFKVQNNINKTAYTGGVFSIMCLVLLTGAWDKILPRLG